MSVIDEIKERLDIVEVISSSVPLKKSGKNYKALCPFHSEKTPSFVVFPDSQRWHCFGACNEGGDVFNFVMKREGWDFHTALEELARQAGVELRERTQAELEAEEQRDHLLDILDQAADYYHQLLLHAPEGAAAREYVEKRGLNQETVEAFALGYSPDSWDRIRTHMTEKGNSVEDLIEAGLLVRNEERDRVYDRFRDRLMIPIRNARGRVIGFGARTLDPEGVPKYLNSPQTRLFDKSNTLFGLDLARRAIRREDRVVIVEGYMDVMQAQQAGFENVVAQMGTALTQTQLDQLQRYTKRFTLALDPDAAGINATLRGVEVAKETLEKDWEPVFNPRGLIGHEARLGAEIRVIRLPEGQDPDDLIRESPERWAELAEDAVPVVDFYFQILLEEADLEDTKAKAEIVDRLLPLLQVVGNPVERDDYIQKIARTLRVDARAISDRLHTSIRQGRRARRPQTGPTAVAPKRQQADLEGYCLSAFIQRPSLLTRIDLMLEGHDLEPVQPKDFQRPEDQAIQETWRSILAFEHPDPQEALYAQLPEEIHDRLDELLATDRSQIADDQLDRDVILTFLRIRRRNLKRIGEEIGFLAQEAQEAGDPRADEYRDTILFYTQRLLRTQKALATRSGWLAGREADKLRK